MLLNMHKNLKNMHNIEAINYSKIDQFLKKLKIKTLVACRPFKF